MSSVGGTDLVHFMPECGKCLMLAFPLEGIFIATTENLPFLKISTCILDVLCLSLAAWKLYLDSFASKVEKRNIQQNTVMTTS
jgi:hypothetical protein